MIRRLGLVLLMLVLVSSKSYGGWRDVRPNIQYIHGDNDFIGIDTVLITYGADTLEWCALELERQLEGLGHIVASTLRVDEQSYFTSNEPATVQTIHLCLYPSSQIFRNVFQNTLHLLRRTPGAEGYHGIIQFPYQFAGYPMNFHNRGLIAALTAGTYRSMNYAVTSFWQAVDSIGNQRVIRTGKISDYPTFPRRIAGDPYDFHPDIIKWAGHTVFTTQTSHGRMMLNLARDILLNNKGNTLFQYADATHYDTLNSSLSNLREAMSVFRDGNAAPVSGDRWGAFGFDYVPAINTWERLNHEWYYKSYEIVKDCRLVGPDQQHGGRYEVIPDATYQPPNGDFFEPIADGMQFWFPVAANRWNIITNGRYGRILIPNDNNYSYYLSRAFQVQDTTSMPSRQVLIELDVRTDQPIAINAKFVLPPDTNGLGNMPDCYKQRYRHNRNTSITQVANTQGAWKTIHLFAFTSGLMYDSVRFDFRNTSGSQATVDVDNFRIRDADFFFPYFIAENSRAYAIIYHNGTRVDSLPSSDFLIEDNYAGFEGNWDSWVHHRGRFFLDYDLQDAVNTYRAEVHYDALWNQNVPTFVSDTVAADDGQNYNARFSFEFDSDSGDVYKPHLRSNSPELFDDVVYHHMNMFEDSVDVGNNGIKIRGFFNRLNELDGVGFMQEDTSEARLYGGLPGIYGHFNSVMYDTLDSLNGHYKRPLFL